MRDAVAGELVGDDAPRFLSRRLEDSSKEAFRRRTVAFFGKIDVEDLAILVDGTPELVLGPADSDEDFINEEAVA